jgi:bifunctional non-homologous end joining protein LigD
MPNRLSEYRRKRDFAATPEPPAPARAARAKSRARFIIHLHHARRRHFDLRLQIGNSLRSWAVPKGPSLDPSAKRLAVEVEDHPLDYGSFEGVIPEGHYGAGKVWIWDRGLWTPEGDPQKALKAGRLHFSLDGERLHGAWSLVRTHLGGKQPQWLLIKSHDGFERAGDEADDTPLSEWLSVRAPARAAAPSKPAKKVRNKAPVRAAPPAEIELQLARLVETAPAGEDWLHEMKFDGYRVLLWRHGEEVRIRSRGNQEWTAKLPAAAAALRSLHCDSCVLDGELVSVDPQGRSSFSDLQQGFGAGGDTGALGIMVFDLLYLDGADLRPQPQLERKKALAKLLHGQHAPLQLTEYLTGHGPEAAQRACADGLEGIVCKAADAAYVAGRGGAWLKVKCVQSDEYAIVGYTTGQGARARLGSLLLARPEAAGRWRYFGRVGTGMDEAMIGDLLKHLHKAPKPVSLENPPDRAQLRGAKPVWVKPEWVVETEYRGFTADGLLRQASLKGLRQDRTVNSLRPSKRDAARVAAGSKPRKHSPAVDSPAPKDITQSAAPRRASKSRKTRTSTVTLTHPERMLFDNPPITKQELAEFYTSIADFILPGLVGRPLLLLRCPEGAAGECFFQKHISPGFPPSVHEVWDPEARRKWIYIDDLDGLLGLVQMSAVEYHVWGGTAAKLDIADRLVMDLDPATGVPWKRVVEAAQEVRERLSTLGLKSFVRTSGGKGLHVVLPLNPGSDWTTAKSFAHALAESMSREQPKRYLAVASKSRREGRIFIDYLRNGRGSTAVCSYSLRHRPGAPIATPLSWEELPEIRSAGQFGYATIRQRLVGKRSDPWKGIEHLRQSLPRLP